MGTPSITSVKMFSSLGNLELKLKDLVSISIGDTLPVAYRKDGNKITGKLELEEITLKGLLGSTTLKVSQLQGLDVTLPNARSASPRKDGKLGAAVRLRDGTALQGTVEWTKLALE